MVRLLLVLMASISPVRSGRVAKRSISSITSFDGLPLSDFEKQWDLIGDMLANLESRPPIENMGANALQSIRNGRDFRFQTLVGTMLSPQTRDEQTSAAFHSLTELVSPSTLCAESLGLQSEVNIAQAISMVSFYKIKARNLLEAARRCVSEYRGDIPDRIEDLLSFRGVGPKVGYLTFTIARNETHGICVDTHVHRIANRLGWADTAMVKSNGPEKTRIQLETWVEKKYWGDVNSRVVAFGQSICTAKAPKCSSCTLVDSCLFFKSCDGEDRGW